jgi:hypothetical protein
MHAKCLYACKMPYTHAKCLYARKMPYTHAKCLICMQNAFTHAKCLIRMQNALYACKLPYTHAKCLICMHSNSFPHLNLHVRTCVDTWIVYASICDMCIHLYLHTYIRTCMHIHHACTYTCIHVYIHTYVCVSCICKYVMQRHVCIICFRCAYACISALIMNPKCALFCKERARACGWSAACCTCAQRQSRFTAPKKRVGCRGWHRIKTPMQYRCCQISAHVRTYNAHAVGPILTCAHTCTHLQVLSDLYARLYVHLVGYANTRISGLSTHYPAIAKLPAGDIK